MGHEIAPLYYRWNNNPHRRDHLYGRPCHIVARGKMNSVLVEFTDRLEPRRTLCSRHAVGTVAPVRASESLF